MCAFRVLAHAASLAFALSPAPALAQSHDVGNRAAGALEMVDMLDPSAPPKLRSVPRVTCRGICADEPAEPTQPAAPPAKPPSISMQVGFDFDSDRIQLGSIEVLSNLARALQHERLQAKAFDVVGHTDATGGFGYNMGLSQRRAVAVKNYLVGQGVDASRLKTIGKGPAELLNPAQPAAAENRRVQVVVSG